jgi:hypothetical protein
MEVLVEFLQYLALLLTTLVAVAVEVMPEELKV